MKTEQPHSKLILRDSIIKTIEDNELSTFESFYTLLSMNKALSKSVADQLDAYMADKEALKEEDESNINKAKEIIKKIEEYMKVSSSIIKLLESN